VQELLQNFWHFIQDNSTIQTGNLVYFPCVGKTDEKTSRRLQIWHIQLETPWSVETHYC
jgi:hypothetical protein